MRSIQEFSDLKTQRRLWLDPNASNPHYTFVEYMCCYFDGLAFFDDPTSLSQHYTVAREQGLVNADEAAAAEPFHAILATYAAPGNDDYDHQAILADPKWGEVVAAAKSAQSALLPLIRDAGERRELMEKNISAVEAGATD